MIEFDCRCRFKYRLKYTLSSDRTHRFCASPRVAVLSKPVTRGRVLRRRTSFGRCAVRPLTGQSIGSIRLNLMFLVIGLIFYRIPICLNNFNYWVYNTCGVHAVQCIISCGLTDCSVCPQPAWCPSFWSRGRDARETWVRGGIVQGSAGPIDELESQQRTASRPGCAHRYQTSTPGQDQPTFRYI